MGYNVPYVSKDFVIEGSEVDLRLSLDEIWKALDKRVRTSIRKGQRFDTRIRPFAAKDLPTVIPITPNDDDIPPVWSDRLTAFVAETGNGEFLGWVLFTAIPHTQRAFMLCHASTKEGKARQTPNLLLWHAMSAAKDKGFAYYDVGGSFRSTLQSYFSGFRQSSYPLIMRPPDLPMDLRITPYDTTAYGDAQGAATEGRALISSIIGTDEWTFTPRGAWAIEVCLRELKERGQLTAEDEVCVTTTTDTPYISSCVTQAIERVCRWSQVLSDQTKAVFLIHEFGFVHPRAPYWRNECTKRGIPLIEDMAYGLGSKGVGEWGDYKIVSFTKIFPVQFGGALVGIKIPHERLWKLHGCSDFGKEEDILTSLASAQPLELIRAKRQEIWNLYNKHLSSLAPAFFSLEPDTLPGAYILRLGDEMLMKEVTAFVKTFGIEVGNWYHHAAIFLPCHQRMTERHVRYICGAIRACYREWCGVPGKRH